MDNQKTEQALRMLQSNEEYLTMLKYTDHLADLIAGDEQHELWPIFQINQGIIIQWEQRPGFREPARQTPSAQAAPQQESEREAANAGGQGKETDLSKRLRKASCNPGCTHENMTLFMQAADEIERYYGGMLAWKATAEAKDRPTAVSALGQPSAQAEPVKVTLPERVIDVLLSSADVSTFHPNGDQLEKLHKFAHGVTEEVLARLPAVPAPVVPDGFVIVPKEPTEEMHVAAVRTVTRCTGNDDFPPRVWRAMIAAAPVAQSVPDTAQPQANAALRKLCDQLEGMKRTMFLMPGTGQNYSYLLYEDVDAYIEEARKSLATQPQEAGQATAEMEDMLGRIHPHAMPAEERRKAEERLRRAYCIQQPFPVPDQAAIVWRADLMRLVYELQHKRAYFEHHTKEAAQAAPAVPDTDAKDVEYLSANDIASLLRFNECCEDSDSGGHDVGKENMRRLAELGVVRSLGFGRHEMTAFGRHIIDRHFKQGDSLPLRTCLDACNLAAIAASQQSGQEPQA